MPRKSDQSIIDPYGHASRLIDKNAVIQVPWPVLKSGGEGIIFRSSAGDDLSAIDEIETIIETLVESMECLWNVDKSKKGKLPAIKFHEFMGSENTVTEDICVFFCERKGKRWPSMGDAAKLFLEMHFAQQRESKGEFPAFIRSIVLFSRCCVATTSTVKTMLKLFVDEAIAVLRDRGKYLQMHAYDVSIEVHENETLEGEKDNLAALIHEKFGKWTSIVVFDANFERTLAGTEGLGGGTLLVKVTVFADQAYFGVLEQGNCLNGYRFVNC